MQFEYIQEYLDFFGNSGIEDLNVLGAEGWEICHMGQQEAVMMPAKDGKPASMMTRTRVILKRRKHEKSK